MYYTNVEVELSGEVLVINGEESTCLVMMDFTYYSGQPAKLWGAPEECYPEQNSEVEIENFRIQMPDGEWVDIEEDMLSKESLMFLENEAFETVYSGVDY